MTFQRKPSSRVNRVEPSTRIVTLPVGRGVLDAEVDVFQFLGGYD
jgi:hypothetical protein